jgi:putative membrane protein
MRYLKFFILVVLFVLSMFFFVQNTAALSTVLQLELNLVFTRFYSQPLPVYVWILMGFFAGALVCLACFVVERVRMGVELKSLRTRASALEDELLALRTQPIGQGAEQPGQSAADKPDGQPIGL